MITQAAQASSADCSRSADSCPTAAAQRAEWTACALQPAPVDSVLCCQMCDQILRLKVRDNCRLTILRSKPLSVGSGISSYFRPTRLQMHTQSPAACRSSWRHVWQRALPSESSCDNCKHMPDNNHAKVYSQLTWLQNVIQSYLNTCNSCADGIWFMARYLDASSLIPSHLTEEPVQHETYMHLQPPHLSCAFHKPRHHSWTPFLCP